MRNCPPILLLLSITRLAMLFLLSSSLTARPAGPAPIIATVVLYTLTLPSVEPSACGRYDSSILLTSFTWSTLVMHILRIFPSTNISQAPHFPMPHSIVLSLFSRLCLCTTRPHLCSAAAIVKPLSPITFFPSKLNSTLSSAGIGRIGCSVILYIA